MKKNKTALFSKRSDAKAILASYQDTLTIHAKSIVSTIFGDIVSPYGGRIWLENLVQLAAPLGINERLIRTILFRLSDEKWVYGTRLGRRSYYQLTESALTQTQQTEPLIYQPRSKDWDGHWLFVFLVIKPVDTEARTQLEQKLKWMGFGTISRHVWAHPEGSIEHVQTHINELGLASKVVCMRAQNIFDIDSGLTLDDSQLVQLCTPTQKVEDEYQAFINHFSPLHDCLPSLITNSSANELMALRILLIDQFRRIILHDPHLPQPLLPDNWIGQKAWELCQEIYQPLIVPGNDYYVELCKDNTEISCKQSKKIDTFYNKRFSVKVAK